MYVKRTVSSYIWVNLVWTHLPRIQSHFHIQYLIVRTYYNVSSLNRQNNVYKGILIHYYYMHICCGEIKKSMFIYAYSTIHMRIYILL